MSVSKTLNLCCLDVACHVDDTLQLRDGAASHPRPGWDPVVVGDSLGLGLFPLFSWDISLPEAKSEAGLYFEALLLSVESTMVGKG